VILLVTNKRDLTTDFIVVELRRRGRAFHRLNTECLPQTMVRFDPRAGHGWEIETPDLTHRLDDVGGAYYRRPGAPEPVLTKDEATTKYLTDEWSAVSKALWYALEGRWLSSPFAILRAEDKPRQLTLASQLGLDLPETLISNDFAVASSCRTWRSRRSAFHCPARSAQADGPDGGVARAGHLPARGTQGL